MRSLLLAMLLVALGACERRIDIVGAKRLPDLVKDSGTPASKELVAQLPIDITQDSFRRLAGRKSPVNFILYHCDDPDGRRSDTKLSVGGTPIRGWHRDWPTESQWRDIEKANLTSDGKPVTILVEHTANLLDDDDYLCGHFERDFWFDPLGTAKMSRSIRFPQIRKTVHTSSD
jgi:hypothetical protein